MDQGIGYTYKDAAFPRYRFFQQHLQRLSDRWQQILDAGSLPDCISQGRGRLKEILSKARQIDDTVTVNVFADRDFLETGELILQCNQKVRGQVGTLSWDNFIDGSMKGSETTVTVIVLRSNEERVNDNLQKQLSRVSKDELRRVIIYFVGTKTSVPYTDVFKMESEDSQQADEDTVTSKTIEHELPLNEHIQFLLEESVILVLNRIADFNKELVPKKQCHGESDMLESAIYSELKKSMRSPFVVKDLSPDENDKPEEAGRKATDDELLRLSSAIDSNWELLGPPLGVTTGQMDDIKLQHKTDTQNCYEMMNLWRQKEDSKLTYLLQLLENFSNVIKMDMNVVKEIEQALPAPVTVSDKDKIFHEKLVDFVSRKTKCVVCDKLSMKYGISATIINELLNDGFYGYVKKVEELMNNMDLPSWPRDKSDDGVATCRMFAYQCATNMTKMIRETEDYIKVKHWVLVILKRLQFQLFGILQETNVPYETKIPEIPKLPFDLQHDILKISDVYGCGTIWGELVIHMTKDLNQYKRDEIEILLSKNMYMYGYTTEVIDTDCEDAGSFYDIEHGHGIRAKKSNTDEYEYGSLGCFVFIRRRSDEASDANNSLYGLTCAHCVLECDVKVEIQRNDEYEDLGVKQHYIYEPNTFDVATVEIIKPKASKCEKALKNSNQASIKSWKFQESPRLKTPVYKYGSKTGLTCGTCTSIDYQKKMMEELNEKIENKEERLYYCNNILISREDIQENLQIHGITGQHTAKPRKDQEKMEIDSRVTKFSQSGDSGSVVCKDGPDNETCIDVLSLLIGSVYQKNGETYSYSNHIHKTVDELEKRFNCVIQPAYDSCGEERL